MHHIFDYKSGRIIDSVYSQNYLPGFFFLPHSLVLSFLFQPSVSITYDNSRTDQLTYCHQSTAGVQRRTRLQSPVCRCHQSQSPEPASVLYMKKRQCRSPCKPKQKPKRSISITFHRVRIKPTDTNFQTKKTADHEIKCESLMHNESHLSYLP